MFRALLIFSLSMTFFGACDVQRKSSTRESARPATKGFLAREGNALTARPPLVFAVAKEVPGIMAAACERAALTLNQAAGRKLIQWESSRSRPFRLHYFSNANLAANHQASTELTTFGSFIVGAEIQIDQTRYIYSDSPTGSEVDSESLCLHELGHALGLDHSPNEDSFMYSTLKGAQIRRALSDSDIKVLKSVY